MITVSVKSIAPQTNRFRAIALSQDGSTIYVHQYGPYWAWMRKGDPSSHVDKFADRAAKFPKVIHGKFMIKADE